MTYTRKTRDLWDIEGDFHYGDGWEAVTTETTRKQALARLREYRENEPSGTYRLKKYREKITEENSTYVD